MVVAPGAAETNVASGAAWGDGGEEAVRDQPFDPTGFGPKASQGNSMGAAA